MFVRVQGLSFMFLVVVVHFCFFQVTVRGESDSGHASRVGVDRDFPGRTFAGANVLHAFVRLYYLWSFAGHVNVHVSQPREMERVCRVFVYSVRYGY